MASFSVVNGAIRLRKFGGKFKSGVKYPLVDAAMYEALKPLVTLGDVLIEMSASEEAKFEKQLGTATEMASATEEQGQGSSDSQTEGNAPSNE